MIGTTLRQIRQYVDAMAEPEGRFYVVCARTGEQPTPLRGRRFVSRSAARSALGAAEQYRAALGRYDPNVTRYDLIVCEGPDPGTPSERDSAGSSGGSATTGDPAVPGQGGTRPRIDFCHDVAAALFEALAPREEDRIEEAIMDAYLERAERVADPDELCLRLLETAAGEIDGRLDVSEQRRLLDEAAERLPATARNQVPIERTLARLATVELIGTYHVTRRTRVAGPTCSVRIVDYALHADGRRVPTLPVAIGLRRRYPGSISIPRVLDRGDGDWEFDLELRLDGAGQGVGLFSAPVGEP